MTLTSAAIPRVLTSMESFADVTIREDGEPPLVVQVVSRFWVYDDQSWMMAIHNADNPAINHIETGDNAAQMDALWHRAAFLRRLAGTVHALLPLLVLSLAT